MRILHVIRSLDPATGGPPMVAARLAAAQVSLGHDASVLTYRDPARQADVDRALGSVPHFSLNMVLGLNYDGRRERWLLRVARRVREVLSRGCDVIHLHGVWDTLLKVAAAEGRRAGVPYVVRPCGMLDPWSLEQRKWKKKLALAMGYRTMLDRALFLHALNSDEARLIEPLGLHCPIEVIPNGVFVEEIEPLPQPGSFRAAFPAVGDRPYVLFLSRLHIKKGLNFLGEAFAAIAERHPGVGLVVAGPDGGAREPFERQIAAAGLSERVHVVGPLYGADKYAAMVDATCLCLPSHQEGFSIALLESLACGLPVVISESCHFPEVVEREAGIVVPLNSQALAKGLDQMLSDPAAARRRGANGREYVLGHLTWQKVAARTIDAYRRRIDGAPGPIASRAVVR